MTLVAIYYSPASSKVKTTTINSNFTSKWKRGISLLSTKRKVQCSPTTVAAATEKVLCHKTNANPHGNGIKCEDLTAKEFAKMAGIKLKSEAAGVENDDEILDYVSVTATAPACQQYSTTCIDDEPMTSQMTSASTRTALSSKSCHQIWDSDFWQCNLDNHNKLVVKGKPSSTSDTTLHDDTLFLSRLRSYSSTMENSNNHNMTVPAGVIQKGRFQIMVGQDDCCEPVTQHHHIVLEWKRKRSDSSSTNLATKKKQPIIL